MTDYEINRGIYLSKQLVKKYEIQLQNCNLVTECASGPYAFTAVIAALAGAKVFAIGKDSKYGNFNENKKVLFKILTNLKLQNNVQVYKNVLPKHKWKTADIVLNTGFVRPINKAIIKNLKRNAVIPLMWETWEYREDDLDLNSCQEKGIPVIGTNENYAKLNMFPYSGMLALKLLFELGIEGHNNHILLLGGGKIGKYISKCFQSLGIKYTWCGAAPDIEKGREDYNNLNKIILDDSIDAIICAEHEHNMEIIGKKGFITFHEIKKQNPIIVFGHIAGKIDLSELKETDIKYFPNDIRPFGYMSYQAFNLGIKPVLELHAAGIKVGEIASKARRKGFSVKETINICVQSGLGQDFKKNL